MEPRKGGKLDAERDSRGRFTKGHNSNGGRPKMPEDVKQMCRELTPKAIETAKNIMLDEDARASDRLRAAEIILDRGYGKPVQAVDLDASSIPQVVFVGDVPD